MRFWKKRGSEERKEEVSSTPELANVFAEILQRLEDHERRLKSVELKCGTFPAEATGNRKLEELKNKSRPSHKTRATNCSKRN